MWIKYRYQHFDDSFTHWHYHEFELTQTNNYIRIMLEEMAGNDGYASVEFEHVDQPPLEYIQQRLAWIESQIAKQAADMVRFQELERQIRFNDMSPLEKVQDRLKYTQYYNCVSVEGDLVYFRLNTDDNDPKEQWEEFTDVCDDLQTHLGLELTEFTYDHDTIWGYVRVP